MSLQSLGAASALAAVMVFYLHDLRGGSAVGGLSEEYQLKFQMSIAMAYIIHELGDKWNICTCLSPTSYPFFLTNFPWLDSAPVLQQSGTTQYSDTLLYFIHSTIFLRSSKSPFEKYRHHLESILNFLGEEKKKKKQG
jgi:hypothetical protein